MMSEPGIFGPIADAGVTTATFAETMGGAGNGAGADIFGGLSQVLQNGKVGGKGLMDAIKGFGGQVASKAIGASIVLAYAGITAAALAAIKDGFDNATAETIKPLMKAGYGSDWDAPKGGGGTMGDALPGLDFEGIGGSGGKTVKNSISEPFGGQYRITSDYGIARKYRNLKGELKEDIHSGLDYGAPGGTPIKSVGSGKVVVNRNEPGGKGNMVIVAHPNGYQSIYGHMQQKSPLNEGARVTSSTVLGKVGKTGSATGNHLHFGVQDKTGKLYNPHDFIDDKLPPIGGGGSMGVATSDYTNNYGGVTVNINMPANAVINETTLAQEIKRVLTQDARIREAVRS
jgi:murein DD-endopeptidase MepM/ murein hydrolase activator NlpD